MPAARPAAIATAQKGNRPGLGPGRSSCHTPSAFAFAFGVEHVLPWSIPPLVLLAAAVGYSRVHTGVHYPGDVVIGALSGVIIAEASNTLLDKALPGSR